MSRRESDGVERISDSRCDRPRCRMCPSAACRARHRWMTTPHAAWQARAGQACERKQRGVMHAQRQVVKAVHQCQCCRLVEPAVASMASVPGTTSAAPTNSARSTPMATMTPPMAPASVEANPNALPPRRSPSAYSPGQVEQLAITPWAQSAVRGADKRRAARRFLHC